VIAAGKSAWYHRNPTNFCFGSPDFTGSFFLFAANRMERKGEINMTRCGSCLGAGGGAKKGGMVGKTWAVLLKDGGKQLW
jgi:hypothetical protein